MKRLFVYIVNCMSILLILIVLLLNVKTSIVDVPHKWKLIGVNFFPEGWGFFTRNPREKQSVLFKKKKKTYELITYKNSSFANWWGFSKKSRRISLEKDRLVGRLLEKDGTNYYIVERDSLFHYLHTGEYLLVEYSTTPWSFLNEQYKINKEYRKIKFIDNDF